MENNTEDDSEVKNKSIKLTTFQENYWAFYLFIELITQTVTASLFVLSLEISTPIRRFINSPTVTLDFNFNGTFPQKFIDTIKNLLKEISKCQALEVEYSISDSDIQLAISKFNNNIFKYSLSEITRSYNTTTDSWINHTGDIINNLMKALIIEVNKISNSTINFMNPKVIVNPEKGVGWYAFDISLHMLGTLILMTFLWEHIIILIEVFINLLGKYPATKIAIIKKIGLGFQHAFFLSYCSKWLAMSASIRDFLKNNPFATIYVSPSLLIISGALLLNTIAVFYSESSRLRLLEKWKYPISPDSRKIQKYALLVFVGSFLIPYLLIRVEQ